MDAIISQFASMAWGLPLITLLIGGGLFLTIYSKGRALMRIGLIPSILNAKESQESTDLISPTQALATALSSTIGMGNIAGVAIAISIGGPGAIFWMWVSAIIGMTTKFFTCSLALMYRRTNPDGTKEGGPMYFIEEGLGKKWKPLAMFFAFAGMIGALPMFNVNQLTQALRDIVLVPSGVNANFTSNFIIGIALTILTAIVTLGGVKRISRISERLVPFMVIIYFLCVFYIILVNITKLPSVFGLIFSEAFAPTFYKGEPFLGGMLGGLMLLGIRRGAFSNEAGIGTAPLAHGASSQPEPLYEGLSAMIGPFLDTIIVCTLTALAILLTGVWQISETNGVTLTLSAFTSAMPNTGGLLLMICIAVFSISSLFSYSYYGTKCMTYLFGKKNGRYYQPMYLGSIVIGATTSLDAMVNLIDGFYGLMAFPTMIATLLLAPKVLRRMKEVWG